MKIFISTILISVALYASTLSMYQDSTIYTYKSKSNFLGFTANAKVKCGGKTTQTTNLRLMFTARHRLLIILMHYRQQIPFRGKKF